MATPKHRPSTSGTVASLTKVMSGITLAKRETDDTNHHISIHGFELSKSSDVSAFAQPFDAQTIPRSKSCGSDGVKHLHTAFDPVDSWFLVAA